MANTVTILSYANTFGEWMVNTNQLAREVNDLAAGTYTKNAGLLVLNSSNTSLQVSNTALFTGNIRLTGSGTALTTTNDIQVGRNINIVNTVTTANLVVTESLGGTAVILFRQRILDEAMAMSIALS
jgi:hypothetical protein